MGKGQNCGTRQEKKEKYLDEQNSNQTDEFNV